MLGHHHIRAGLLYAHFSHILVVKIDGLMSPRGVYPGRKSSKFRKQKNFQMPIVEEYKHVASFLL